MAGTAKPDIVGLKKEDSIIFSNESIVESSPFDLINGNVNDPSLINLGGKCYFTVLHEVNIWAYGYPYRDGGGISGQLVNLYKVEDKEETFINRFPTQYASGWYKLFDHLKKGTYKLTTNARYVCFGEWYVELCSIECLLKFNNQFYSIKNEFYDTTALAYTPLESFDFSQAFFLNTLFLDTTVENETFKPIDKINNFEIIHQDNDGLQVIGIRSAKELIVASDDISCSVAQIIEYFKLITKQSENGAIKVAISIDKGHSWNVYSNGTLLPLDITIPLKPFTDLTDNEKAQYNNALDLILEQGITAELFNKIDFNTLTGSLNTIRFAYGIYRPGYDDVAETDTLSWKYDAKGSMRLMKDSEFQVDVYGRNVKYTSFIENPLMKVNVMV